MAVPLFYVGYCRRPAEAGIIEECLPVIAGLTRNLQREAGRGNTVLTSVGNIFDLKLNNNNPYEQNHESFNVWQRSYRTWGGTF